MNIFIVSTLVILIISLFISITKWIATNKKNQILLSRLESLKIAIEEQKEKTSKLRYDIKNLSEFAVNRYEIAKELEEENQRIIIQNENLVRISDELKSSLEENKKLQKLRSGKFRMIIHDLKNPLNLILNSIDSNDIPELHASAIRHQAEEMLRLITNILGVSRFEESEIQINSEEFSISSLFGKVKDRFSQLSKFRSIGLRFKAKGGITIKGDFLLLERVLVNLLENSIRFTPPLGFIDVCAVSLNGFIRIEVKDTGTGIHYNMLKTVFDEFISNNAKAYFYSNPTGIGLTFCKLVIEAHGGRIGIISNEGTGTRIWFIVPAGMKNDTEIEVITEIPQISCILSENDKLILKNQIEELHKTDIRQVSEVLKILKTIPGDNDRIRLWREAVENSVFSANPASFRKLLN